MSIACLAACACVTESGAGARSDSQREAPRTIRVDPNEQATVRDAGAVESDAEVAQSDAGLDQDGGADVSEPLCTCGDGVLCGLEECDDGKSGSPSCFQDCLRNPVYDTPGDCNGYVAPGPDTPPIWPGTPLVEQASLALGAAITTVIRFVDILAKPEPYETNISVYSVSGPIASAQYDTRSGSDLELVGHTISDRNMSWHYVASSDGAGSFSAPRLLWGVGGTAGLNGHVMAGADFNGDARPDFIFHSSAWPYAREHRVVRVSLSTGQESSLYENLSLSIQLYPEDIKFADLNGDGRDDIYATYQGACGWSVLSALSLGDGTFTTLTRQHLAAQRVPLFAARALDVTGDGVADFVRTYASDGGHILEVSRGSSDGHFSAPLSTVGPKVSATPIFADINGDGKLDAAFIEPADDKLKITSFSSMGNGYFSQVVSGQGVVEVGSISKPEVRLLDLNDDYRADLVVSGGVDNLVVIGVGNGTFAGSQSLPAGNFFTGDFNGDGKTDVVTSRTTGGSIMGNTGAWELTTRLAQE